MQTHVTLLWVKTLSHPAYTRFRSFLWFLEMFQVSSKHRVDSLDPTLMWLKLDCMLTLFERGAGLSVGWRFGVQMKKREKKPTWGHQNYCSQAAKLALTDFILGFGNMLLQLLKKDAIKNWNLSKGTDVLSEIELICAHSCTSTTFWRNDLTDVTS